MPLLVLLFIATFTVSAAAQYPRTRDSAGVHIIEAAARSSASVAFVLSDRPRYDVGGLKPNPDDELNNRSIVSLDDIPLSNGQHVVSDGPKFRVFDAAGKQVRVVGREGQGPGEFRQTSKICRTRGDTIAVHDPGNARVTIYDPSGKMVKEIPVGALHYLSGCFSDGTMLMSQTDRSGSVATSILTRQRIDGTVAGTIGVFPLPDFGFWVTNRLSFVADGTESYVGDNRANEVRVYAFDGKLIRIIRFADPPAPTSAAERAAMQPRAAPSLQSGKEALDRFNERMRSEPRPTVWPSYDRIAVDPEGRLWVEDYKTSSTAPDVWTAFDVSGRMLGKVTVPAWKRSGDPFVRSFTSGGVLMSQDDNDGAHHLVTYALVPMKGGSH